MSRPSAYFHRGSTYRINSRETRCIVVIWALEKCRLDAKSTERQSFRTCNHTNFSLFFIRCSSYSGSPPEEGFKECTACPPEQFTFQPGAHAVDECREKCAPGTYSDTGLAPCAQCPVNFFQPLSGQRQCFECHTTEETAGEFRIQVLLTICRS